MVLGKNAKVELIRHVPLFAGCSKRELGAIASVADELLVPEGKVLMREGDRGHEFIVVAEGTVEVRRKGRKLPVRGGTDFFGEIALLTNTPRTATVTATSPLRTLVITDRAFRRLLEESPSIRLKVLEALAQRLAPDVV